MVALIRGFHLNRSDQLCLDFGPATPRTLKRALYPPNLSSSHVGELFCKLFVPSRLHGRRHLELLAGQARGQHLPSTEIDASLHYTGNRCIPRHRLGGSLHCSWHRLFVYLRLRCDRGSDSEYSQRPRQRLQLSHFLSGRLRPRRPGDYEPAGGNLSVISWTWRASSFLVLVNVFLFFW